MMKLEWIFNMTNWNKDYDNWVFTFEITDIKSWLKMEVSVDRKSFADSLISSRWQFEKNCEILIPENIWKNMENKFIYISTPAYIDDEKKFQKHINKYLISEWLANEWWKYYYTHRQWADHHSKNEIKVSIYRYV